MREQAQGPLLLPVALLTLASATVALALDLLLPLGVAGGVPYLLAVWFALMAWRPKFTLLVAIGCSLLSVAGVLLSPEAGGTEFWKIFVNRGMALFAIWVTAGFGLICQRRHPQGQTSETSWPAPKSAGFAYGGTVVLLSVVIIGALGLLFLHQQVVEAELLDTAILHDARTTSRMLRNVRSIYTKEVVEPARKQGVAVTHDNAPGSIPLPATFSMKLGNHDAHRRSAIKARLSSPYPWRKENGGLRDAFARDAWKFFQDKPDQEFSGSSKAAEAACFASPPPTACARAASTATTITKIRPSPVGKSATCAACLKCPCHWTT